MKAIKPRKILRAAAVNLSAKVAGGVFGLLQVVLIAREFGISAETDAYMIALWLPMFFWSMGETVLAYSLVPYLVAVQETEGSGGAKKAADAIFFWFVIVLLGISVLVFMASPLLPYLLAPGFPDGTRDMTSYLLKWLAPVIFVGGLGAFLSCIFYSSHRFVVPAAVSLLPDVGVISLLLVGVDRWGIRAPAMGFLAGALVQTVVMVMALAMLRKCPHFRYYDIREFFKVLHLVGPRLGGASMNRFNIGVDRFFASILGSGAVSAMTYSYRLVQIPLGFAIAAFGKTLMPTMTQEVVRSGSESLRGMIPKCIGFAGFGLAPLVLFFVFYSEPIIRILYQRGAFNPEATRIAAEVFQYYSIGILFNAFCIIFQGAFYVLRDTLTPLKVGIVALVLNILLDILLLNLMGLPGIALASVLVAICSMVYLHRVLTKKIGAIGMGWLFSSFQRIVPASIVLGGMAWATAAYLSPYIAMETRRMQALLIGVIFVLSWGIYLVLCRLLRVQEYLTITRYFEKKS